jgi:hypothetical protein
VAAQFHPEFKSRPGRASPLFLGFILASARKLNSYLTSRTTPMQSPMSTPQKQVPAAAAAAMASLAAAAAGLEGFSLNDGQAAGNGTTAAQQGLIKQQAQK